MKKTILFSTIMLSIFTYAYPMKSMMGANGIANTEADEGTPLPDGVIAVEYLESTGKEYIDTGWYLSSKDIVTVKATCFNRGSVFGIFNGQENNFNLTGSGSNSLFRYGGGSNISPTDIGETYVFECGENFKIDNVIIGIRVYDFSTSQTGFMFARRVGKTAQDFLIGRIYWLKIASDGVNVMHFIPVKVLNADNQFIGAMYDLVSGTLFYNAGTGAFIIGPDKE